MKDLQREILSQVAAGTISAEEGAARLEALESAPTTTAPAPQTPSPAPAPSVSRVRVTSRFGNAEIIGDPSIATAVAEGPHKARQDGDTMVIDQTLLADDSNFEFNRPYARVSIPSFQFQRNLVVRMNPALALQSGVQAGNVRIQGVKGPITSEVQAGNCLVQGFAGPVNLSVAAGNLEADGRLDGGSSSIKCQMGEVKVKLDKTSNVRILARSTLGDVRVEGAKDQVVGTGAGTLEISCTMGDVKVSVG
jgi:hypothetical protein